MSNQQLFIPEKCKVGSQLREGTYTGKLGYVIYHDGKVWRKETSWESWRHKEGQDINAYNPVNQKWEMSPAIGVEPIEFVNEPTEGFVLNKKAGGYDTGWNHRQTYCRVYDPRGWEFEITIPNLLFILEECSAFKGKGLEGEFIYSWDGKDLVLLPVSSSDYIACTQFTKLQSQKIGKRDLKEGCTYLTSKQVELIYVGRYDAYLNNNYCHSEHYYYGRISNNQEKLKALPTKTHVFAIVSKDKKGKDRISFIFLNGLTSLKSKVTDECHPMFSEIVEVYHNQSIYSSKAKEIIIRNLDESDIEYFNLYYWNNTLYLKSEFDGNQYREGKSTRQVTNNGDGTFKVVKIVDSHRYDNFFIRDKPQPETKIVTQEELIRDYGGLSRLYENGYTVKI